MTHPSLQHLSHPAIPRSSHTQAAGYYEKWAPLLVWILSFGGYFTCCPLWTWLEEEKTHETKRNKRKDEVKWEHVSARFQCFPSLITDVFIRSVMDVRVRERVNEGLNMYSCSDRRNHHVSSQSNTAMCTNTIHQCYFTITLFTNILYFQFSFQF